MVNLRMLAIAAAILFGAPVAVAAIDVEVPGGTVISEHGTIEALIDEVTLLDPPKPVTGRSAAFRNETLVEGHTVFVTIDIRIWTNVTEGNITALGNVSCGFETGLNTQSTILGIPVPRKTHKTEVKCEHDGTVVATPDPFFDSSAARTELVPTGAAWEFTTPNGDVGWVTEWTFDSARFDPATQQVVVSTYHAWSAPVFDEGWTHVDGTTKRFMIPMPHEKAWGQGVEHYQIVFADDVGL